jgi:hypothetical protein
MPDEFPANPNILGASLLEAQNHFFTGDRYSQCDYHLVFLEMFAIDKHGHDVVFIQPPFPQGL